MEPVEWAQRKGALADIKRREDQKQRLVQARIENARHYPDGLVHFADGHAEFIEGGVVNGINNPTPVPIYQAMQRIAQVKKEEEEENMAEADDKKEQVGGANVEAVKNEAGR